MWKLDHKEGWAPKNWCFWTVVLEKTLESPLDCKEIQPVSPKGNQLWIVLHWKDWCWSSNMLVTSGEERTHWKRPWCWEKLKTGGGDNRGQDGWMVPPTQWTWVWASSGGWWKTGKPGMLQSMGSQRDRHDWATKQRAEHVSSSQPSSHTDPKLALSSVHPFAVDITTICMCAQLLSCVRLFETLRTVAYQAQTWSMGSPRARILEWVAVSFSDYLYTLSTYTRNPRQYLSRPLP